MISIERLLHGLRVHCANKHVGHSDRSTSSGEMFFSFTWNLAWATTTTRSNTKKPMGTDQKQVDYDVDGSSDKELASGCEKVNSKLNRFLTGYSQYILRHTFLDITGEQKYNSLLLGQEENANASSCFSFQGSKDRAMVSTIEAGSQ